MPIQNIEDLLAHVDSKYRLVIIAAKRAKQLARGAAPLVDTRSFKPIYMAMDEVTSGKLQFETEGAQAELARELAEAAAKPTWFRSMVADEADLMEEEAVEEVPEVEEAAEVEVPAGEVPPEAAELLPEEGLEGEIEELNGERPAEEEVAPAPEEEE
jgi:DNA-directed RNA polymerase subunit omega